MSCRYFVNCQRALRIVGLFLAVVGLAPAGIAGAEDFSQPDTNTFHILPTEENPYTLTSIAACLANVRGRTNAPLPVSLTATVTLVDPERSLLVLQDNSAAMGVYLPASDLAGWHSGQNISFTAAGLLPYFRSFPPYPDQPSAREHLGAFDTGLSHQNYTLTRVRGYLTLPVTGNYIFYLAADDGAVLWLSPDADPGNEQKIASVVAGAPTGFEQWDHQPTQSSQEIYLQAGQRYYIETMLAHGTGAGYLAVAWSGPKQARAIIAGKYLSSWEGTGSSLAQAALFDGQHPGLLCESWTNYYIHDLSPLLNRSASEAIARVQLPQLTQLETARAIAPAARRLELDGSYNSGCNLKWTEIEGDIRFAAVAGNRLQLEVAGESARAQVVVEGWDGASVAQLANAHVRLQGVWEYMPETDSTNWSGILYVPASRDLTVVPPDTLEDSKSDTVLISEIEPANPGMTWGRRLEVQGQLKHDAAGWRLQGDDIFQGFYSPDGTNWTPLGKPVEIVMSNSVCAGLVVASHQSTERAAATFTGVSGPGTNWTGESITGRRLGDFTASGLNITLYGIGQELTKDADQFYFLNQGMNGQGEIVARLDGLKSADPSAQAGLMLRESLDRKSAYAAVLVNPGQTATFQCRKQYGEKPVFFGTQPGERWLKLVRRENMVAVQPADAADFQPEEEAKIMGMLIWTNDRPVLVEAFSVPVEESPNPVIDNGLMRDVAIGAFLSRAQRPSQSYLHGYLEGVRLRGVVTFCDRVMGRNLLFVQSGKSALPVVWADNTNLVVSLHAGQSVRLSGRAKAGQSPVVLEADNVRIMGLGELPSPMPYSAGEFSAQSRYGQWVTVQGVVHSVNTNGIVNLMGKEGMLAAWVGQAGGEELRGYVNARVEMRGVVGQDVQNNPLLLVASPGAIEVLEAAPANPFAVPTFPVIALRAVNVKPERLRQMKVSGVVTCVLPQGLFLQDATGGIYVPVNGADPFMPGDNVEAAGFPENDSGAVVLTEAEIHKTGTGHLPEAMATGNQEEKILDGMRVKLEATVVEQFNTPGRHGLELQAGAKMIEATYLANGSGGWRAILAGSRVQISGVVQAAGNSSLLEAARRGAISSPAQWKLWVNRPDDLVVVARPPWWTLKRVAAVGGVFAAALLGALIWVRILRRRVAQRTRELEETLGRLKEEVQTSAVLAERNRLAGEIHDTLQQGLTAIMLQLDTVKKMWHKPEEARRYLAMARNMIGFSHAEVRHAVWDLKSSLLENADLETALQRLAAELNAGDSRLVTVTITGPPRRLPPAVEHHLLRICQEAMMNAIKHAQAVSIRVTLDYQGDCVRLSVKDDGAGFIPEQVFDIAKEGHFGLQGIQARAQKMGAELQIASQPGQGALVAVTLPWNENLTPETEDFGQEGGHS